MFKKKIVAGVDEVGRGCLAGPVFAAAIVLNKKINKKGIKDSKKIPFKKRILLSKYIKKNSVYAVGTASVNEIDKINILNASLLSMQRALNKLKLKPSMAYIDGLFAPKDIKIKYKTFIRGDEKITSIAAASIIAKVSRDLFMIKLAKKYPKYNWHKNFGYGTQEHLLALVAPGDLVSLVVDGSHLIVQSDSLEYLGRVSSKLAGRLIRLIQGGNKYEGAIVRASGNEIGIIIREIHKSASQLTTTSFSGYLTKDVDVSEAPTSLANGGKMTFNVISDCAAPVDVTIQFDATFTKCTTDNCAGDNYHVPTTWD